MGGAGGGLGGISEDGDGGEGGEGGVPGSRSPARRQSNLGGGALTEEGKKGGGVGEGGTPGSPSGLKKSAAGKWAGVKAVVKLMGIGNKSKLKEKEEEPEEEEDDDKEEGLFTPTDDHTLYVTLKAQGAFGELALITNKPRAATAVAKGPTTLLAIQREEYQRIMVGGMAKAIQEKVNFLKASPVFKSLEDSTHHLTSLSYSFHLETLQRGAVLYREGDEPESVYIIKEGFCKVHKAKAKGAGGGARGMGACALAILGPLSVLGEQEVILGCKRKATVVADTKTSLYKMDAVDFRIMPAFILQGLRKEAQMRETFEDKRLESIAGTMEQHRQSTKRWAQSHAAPQAPLSEAQLRAERARSAVHAHSLEHFKPLKNLNAPEALGAARRPKAGAAKKATLGPGAVTKAFLRGQPQMAGGSIERLARPRTPVGEGGIATGIRSDELAVKVGRPDGIERAKRMAEMCRRLKHTRKPHESDLAKLRWNKESDRVSVGAHLQELGRTRGRG